MRNILVDNYILNPKNYSPNLKLANWYLKIEQYSAAIMHYMKCLEADDLEDNNYAVKYHCLCAMSWCYWKLDHRWLGEMQYARFAKAECPDRPEAYYMLCRIWIDKLEHDGCFEDGEWIQVYENARIGILYAQMQDQLENIYYPGIEYLKLFYAISLLRLNKHDELKQFLSETEFTKLDDDYLMNSVQYIYNELRIWNPYFGYSQDNDYDHLKIKFPGVDRLKYNSSESMQDMFVLTALDGQTDGYYIEIGAGDWRYGNNTLLLEQLGWKGVSLEYNSWLNNEFNLHRQNRCLNVDATQLDYRDLIDKYFGKDVDVIDYVSVDIDPAENTLKALYALPFHNTKFRCITFEHDAYQAGDDVKTQAKNYLLSKGYELIAEDVKFNNQCSFEDWYIYPGLVEGDTVAKLKDAFKDSDGIVYRMFYNL